MHIEKDEQKQRFIAREHDPLKAWLVTPALWEIHKSYDLSLPVIDHLLEKTSTKSAPWHAIDATDENYAVLGIYTTLVATLEKALAARADKTHKKLPEPLLPEKHPVKRSAGGNTGEPVCTKADCQPVLDELQEEMIRVQGLLFKRKIPLIIVYRRMGCGGKRGQHHPACPVHEPPGVRCYPGGNPR